MTGANRLRILDIVVLPDEHIRLKLAFCNSGTTKSLGGGKEEPMRGGLGWRVASSQVKHEPAEVKLLHSTAVTVYCDYLYIFVIPTLYKKVILASIGQ